MYNTLSMVTLEIGKNEKQQRLDKFLRKYLDAAPLSAVYKMIRKDVKVNGKRRKEDYILQEGDQLTLYLHEDELARLQKPRRVQHAKKQFKAAYEDDDLLIVVKPAGLLTHGNKQEHRNHLANQVLDYLIQNGQYDPRTEKTFSPAPVNRLDRNTSGLVIFCKNYEALQTFNAIIKERGRVHKRYLTLVSGLLRRPLSLTDRMEKDEEKNRVSIADEGKLMHTEVRPLYSTDKYGGFTLAEVEIETGRTHQIRVQLAAAGHPLAGDPKYGDPEVNRTVKKRWGLCSQFLHAWCLEFENMPEKYAYLNGKRVTAPLPKKLDAVCRDLFGHVEL